MFLRQTKFPLLIQRCASIFYNLYDFPSVFYENPQNSFQRLKKPRNNLWYLAKKKRKPEKSSETKDFLPPEVNRKLLEWII